MGRIGRVLLVEDQATTRSLLAEMLGTGPGGWGYEVTTCATKAEARDLLSKVGWLRGYNGAVVDLRLGSESGADLAKEIRIGYPRCGVIVFTAYATTKNMADLHRWGIVVAEKGDLLGLQRAMKGVVMGEVASVLKEWGILSSLITIASALLATVYRLGGFRQQLSHMIETVDDIKSNLTAFQRQYGKDIRGVEGRLSRLEGAAREKDPR